MEVIKSKLQNQKRNPLIFVPGLYGSMGNTIIPGTGDWSFGMSASIYEPFVEKLEQLGYTRDENLFIAFYDWRQDCIHCADEYLIKTIALAKSKSRSRKVDIICHSMGGLVSRTYVQGNNYQGDVDNLISIGTPNAGAVNAYFFYAGGKLPYNRGMKSNIFRTLLEGYLWIIEKYYGEKNDLDTIHNLLKGAQDLLPSMQYGNYLYYLDKSRNMKFISYDQMHYKNNFLDYINYIYRKTMPKNVKVTLIAGKGIETNQLLQIDPRREHDGQRWIDGRVIDVSKSLEGDGTVMVKSVMAIEGDRYIINGKHEELLERSLFIIRKKLGIDDGYMMRSRYEPIENHISILIDGMGDLQLQGFGENGQEILYDKGVNNIENLDVQKYGERLTWMLITNCRHQELVLNFLPQKDSTLDIIVKDRDGNIKRALGKEVLTKHRYRIQIN
nr:hypothetical protein [Anaerosolibacter carboniphilus]